MHKTNKTISQLVNILCRNVSKDFSINVNTFVIQYALKHESTNESRIGRQLLPSTPWPLPKRY